MNRDRSTFVRRLIWSASLLMLTAGAALAAIPSTSDYRNATKPMITGNVVMVNEHQLRVATEQGGEMTLILDSRSLVPADLSTDMMVRVAFHYLNDGSRHAERVMPVREGQQKTTRELAYSQERDADSDVRLASTSREESAQMGDGTRTVVSSHSTVPATHAYDIATRSAIAGHVARVNDHHIVIDSEQSGRVTLQMDSRTLVPSTLQSGTGVRVDYIVLENGEYLARRVTQDANFAHDGEGVTYEASGDGQQVVDAAPATYQGDAGTDHATTGHVETEETSGTSTNAEGTGTSGASTDGEANTLRSDGRLPDTASPQALIALCGILALAAGAFTLRRRR